MRGEFGNGSTRLMALVEFGKRRQSDRCHNGENRSGKHAFDQAEPSLAASPAHGVAPNPGSFQDQ
ncbi:hypothetical protein NX79_00940 [Xanthomonas vasicola]|nr:hypothetical protein KWQ_0111425 [Xanthomonas vasicola pv. musacearum NCPPB 4380]KFA11108.1 hypothetical protein KWM_0107405 [Xanthomonas vasicola pv. musacearum NCPPB 2005]KFA15735.1 hypothetical protein A11G_0120650 [Xanthomonas vasicola pv. musacearum NCPPB 4392]KFA25938.1 hypothetical protein KWU_0101355 [Xanthomonas vasicola pv. musacearum NCPPB 4394]KFA37368.1 hypothetical protein KWI_0105210 [Xanthomonas vasicola pv. vasculorum NCPPB 206]KFA39947.1 hypothetical protein KWS_0100130 [X